MIQEKSLNFTRLFIFEQGNVARNCKFLLATVMFLFCQGRQVSNGLELLKPVAQVPDD